MTPAIARARHAGPAAGPLVIAGWVALLAAILATIALPPSPITVAAAVVAVLGLSRDPRLGVLPAAIVVILALPYDRAANAFLWRIADIPIRPQDAAVGLAILLSLPRIRLANLRRPGVAPFVLFLAIGLVALAWGMVSGNALRDVLRDGRWWFLYGSAVLLLLTGVPRPNIVRAILVGVTVYAAVVVTVGLLPVFDGALKARALIFDQGLLRMQFGNSAFILVGIAYAARAFLLRPSWTRAGWVVLLGTAAAMSLTRSFILDVVAVAGLTFLLWAWPRRRALVPALRGGISLAAVGVVALALGVSLNLAGANFTKFVVNPPVAAGGGTSGVDGEGEDVLGRILLQNPESGFENISGGRFVTYGRALAIVSANPALGGGLGALVVAEYRFGGEGFATEGKLPNVDNAWLTIGMKAALPGMLAFLLLAAWPLVRLRGRAGRHMAGWYVPAWLGLLALTVTQSYATTGYGPFVLAAFLVLLEPAARGYASSRVSAARRQA